MKKIILPMLILLGCMGVSCNHAKDDYKGSVPFINLHDDVNLSGSDALAVSNLTITQLSGDINEAFFKNVSIIDVLGDTVIILENTPNMSRLIMFDIQNGNYLGEINHRGQGPGEYRVIVGAFVDDSDGSVLIPNFDTPAVYKYSLSNDSLLTTLEREQVMTMLPPIGGAESCINMAIISPEGLTIRQYDSGYERIDSISIPGFRCGNFNTLWDNAGNNGVLMMADTLYTLVPGELRQLAILSRGDHALTTEKDEEITMNVIMNGDDELELLKPFILVRNVQYADGKMLLTTMINGVKHSDLYDLSNGAMLYRSVYEQLSKPSCIVVKDDSGRAFEIERLFAKGGKWYGILCEDGSNISEDTNDVIVSFEM